MYREHMEKKQHRRDLQRLIDYYEEATAKEREELLLYIACQKARAFAAREYAPPIAAVIYNETAPELEIITRPQYLD